MPSGRDSLAIAASFAAAGVLGLAAWQELRSSAEARAAAQLSDALRKEAAAMEVTERKFAEFEREVELLARKQALLDQMMPPALGVPAFVDHYRAFATEHGVTVGETRVREDASKPVMQAEIVTTLSGAPEAVEALLAKTPRMTRLTHWRWQEPGVVVLTIFAFAPGAAPVPAWRCPAVESRVWMWPFTARIEKARIERAGLCARLERLRDVKARVDRLEADRNHFLAVVDEVEKRRPAS